MTLQETSLEIMCSDMIWLCVDFDFPGSNVSNEVKYLVNICAEKLVSDVYLLRNPVIIPKTLYSVLFSTALAKNRTLSLSNLMKYCPEKEVKLSVPVTLKSWHALMETNHCINEEVKKFSNNAHSIVYTFFRLIDTDCPTSQLHCVDLGVFPWKSSLILTIYKFLKKKCRNKFSFKKLYALKGAFTVENYEHIHLLLQAIEAAECLHFGLFLTGLNISNNHFCDKEVLNLLEKIDPSGFFYFSLNFASFTPSYDRIVYKLCSFKNLKYINFSYVWRAFTTDIHLIKVFGEMLTQLRHITHIVLRGNTLRGCMRDLFQHSCNEKEMPLKKLKVEDMQCCIVHRGLLEYLDISACGLTSDDILFLRELHLTDSLTYLNIGYNCFEGRSAYQTLLTVSSSLIVLDIEKSFQNEEYDPELFPLSVFKKLKFLNMKGLIVDSRNEQLLNDEIEKVPDLVVVKTVK